MYTSYLELMTYSNLEINISEEETVKRNPYKNIFLK